MLKRNLFAIMLVIAVFSIIGFNTQAFAFDACRNVTFTIKNDRNGEVEIKNVSFFNQNENNWKTEELPNTKLSRGQSYKTSKQDLGDAEGDNITKIKFEYVDKNDGQRKVSQVFVPGTPRCSADRNYGLYTITGSSTVPESNSILSNDSCRNVVFNYVNGRNGEIKVRKVEYFNQQSGQWKSEDVANEITSQGAKGETNGDDLGDANGDDITKVKFIYEYKSSQRSSNWSDAIESKIFEPNDPTCRENKVYGAGQKWTIGDETTIGGQLLPGTDGVGGQVLTGPDGGGLRPASPTKSASLIYFNYGENSEYTAFFQDTLHVKKAMEGYGRVVLLKANDLPSWADLSEGDERNANVVLPPTKNNFFAQIKDLADKGYFIDIYIFSHGWNDQFGPKNNDSQQITAADITSRLSGNKNPIRTVWGTNCYGSTLATEWHSVGAKTVAGARFINFYPNSYGNFINDWNKGNVSFNSSVSNSDTAVTRTEVQTYILGDATLTRKEWGGCPTLQTVLGNNACAKDYFVTKWLDASQWKNNLNGKDNMNNSSTMIISGDKNLTKNSKPIW